jgi:hypothetical protein
LHSQLEGEGGIRLRLLSPYFFSEMPAFSA